MKRIACPVCRDPVDVRPAEGRKSRKPFIMLTCSRDGRHFRAFINDRAFVDRVTGAAGMPKHDGSRSR